MAGFGYLAFGSLGVGTLGKVSDVNIQATTDQLTLFSLTATIAYQLTFVDDVINFFLGNPQGVDWDAVDHQEDWDVPVKLIDFEASNQTIDWVALDEFKNWACPANDYSWQDSSKVVNFSSYISRGDWIAKTETKNWTPTNKLSTWG